MKTAATCQKLRGGYYTPMLIGEFLAKWAIRAASDDILEPSCGDGVILEAAVRALMEHGATRRSAAARMCGIEFDGAEAQKARQRLTGMNLPVSEGTIQTGDFFTFARGLIPEMNLFSGGEPRRLFDVVIGNPPFVRYQNFAEEHRKIAFELMNQMGLRPSRLTNAWVPFVCVSSMLLKPQGRMALVLPAELLHVGYTAELRLFLSKNFCRLQILTFRKLVFPDIQQEVVLLCAEKNGGTRTGINVVELTDVADLAGQGDEVIAPECLKPMDHSTEKWTQYFLTGDEIALLRTLRQNSGIHRLGALASVDVGVVTGLNEYFVLTQGAKDTAKLNGYTRPIVTRSGHLRGIDFTGHDWKALAQNEQPAYLLDAPPRVLKDLPGSVRDYVMIGEEKDCHRGYKCRIRKLWYIVPSLWIPDAFMLRQIHRYPKIIVNRANATSTDTIHRVRLLKGTDGKRLALACLNSMTFAFAEVIGRSYGGGVLELEPREAEGLPIPYTGSENIDFDQVHSLLLEDRVDVVLDIVDAALLGKCLGLSVGEMMLLRGIWRKLQGRRLNRKASSLGKA